MLNYGTTTQTSVTSGTSSGYPWWLHHDSIGYVFPQNHVSSTTAGRKKLTWKLVSHISNFVQAFVYVWLVNHILSLCKCSCVWLVNHILSLCKRACVYSYMCSVGAHCICARMPIRECLFYTPAQCTNAHTFTGTHAPTFIRLLWLPL